MKLESNQWNRWSMSILWEKSETWRWIVRKTRDSKPFFLAFATICGAVPGVVGYCVMQATNSRNPQLEAQLRRTARPDSLVCLSLPLIFYLSYLFLPIQYNQIKTWKATQPSPSTLKQKFFFLFFFLKQ